MIDAVDGDRCNWCLAAVVAPVRDVIDGFHRIFCSADHARLYRMRMERPDTRRTTTVAERARLRRW